MIRRAIIALVVAAVLPGVARAEDRPRKDPKRHWSRTPYSITVAEEALPADQLPDVLDDHPRLLVRKTPWEGGITVAELRRRAKQEPWKKWFDWVKRKKWRPNQWRPVRALYYLATGDESVVPAIRDYVLAAKPQFNCGGGLVDVCIQYDWIYNSPTLTDADRKKMADRIAQVGLKCAEILQSGWAFDIWTHRAAPGWASDIVAAGLALDDDHPQATKLRSWGMGYYKRNYFRGWQHNGGCWLHGGSSYNIALVLPRVIACWQSATDEDVYGLIREEYGNWLEKHMYYMMCEVLPDRTRSDAIGWDYNPPGLRMPTLNCMMAARAYRNPDCYPYLRRLGRDPRCGRYSGMMQVLFYDEELDRLKPRIPPDAPFSMVWGRRGPGYAQIRSKGWAPDSTVIEFKCGDWVWTHTHQNHSNSFWIFHKGRLAVQAGIYDRYGGNHSDHYYARSISGNTMLIRQPGEFVIGYRSTEDVDEDGCVELAGGQRMTVKMGQNCFTFDEYLRRKTEPNVTGELFEMGDIIAFDHADDFSYTYLCGDASMAYNNPTFCYAYKGRKNKPKIDRFTRSLAWLGNRYLVMFDRVRALDPSYRKAWICHFQGEPKVNGKRTKAPVPGHIEEYDGDTVRATWSDGVCKPPDPGDPGRLFIRTFLPEERVIRRIGGKGYEFWAKGKNRPPTSKKGGRQDMGRWRVEISPRRPARSDHFLHLLYPCDTRTKRCPDAGLVTADDKKMIGLSVGGWLVLFGADGPVKGAVAYEAPEGRTEHLVVDLPHGARYTLAGTATKEEAEMVVTEEGTLRYTTDRKGTVTLTPAD
ncbi:MAG: hypothetical protein R6V58_05435 [Planctomycetota bacterium]